MSLLATQAFANTEAEVGQNMPSPVAQPSIIESVLPFVLIMAVFYFLIIRPQSKKAKELQTTLSRLKKGDDVITTGGIFGKVTKVDEEANTLSIEIADKVNIKVKKEAVLEVLTTNAEVVKTKTNTKSKGK